METDERKFRVANFRNFPICDGIRVCSHAVLLCAPKKTYIIFFILRNLNIVYAVRTSVNFLSSEKSYFDGQGVFNLNFHKNQIK